MKVLTLSLIILYVFSACSQRQDVVVPPWQAEADTSTVFDLQQIEQAGEVIAVTLSGPDTYYDYHGIHFGLQYLLCQDFASHIGVRLRMELCRDTTELIQRLTSGYADIVALGIDGSAATEDGPGWLLGDGKTALREAIETWWNPSIADSLRSEEQLALTKPRVKRRVNAPMLSRGVISYYDEMFKHYSHGIGWDWRLLAAQCYQESTFDPDAVSWAGAKGLMQIMPATADHLGLPRDQMTDPEQNIAAATRYLHELEHEFRYIHDRTERQSMVLASYNGGIHHIRDAMRLAERDQRNSQRWEDVREYVLRLKEPRYYQDTLVHYGYMRGTETADYVDKIRSRYQQYIRQVRQ